MRIALVIERFVPGAGGVENVAWRVAHELARQGESVTVLARDFGKPSAAAPSTRSADDVFVPAEPVEVRRQPLFAPRFWQPLRVLLFSRAAARATRGARFDVVHSFARTRHQDLYRAGGGSHADYLRRQHSPLGQALRRYSPRHRTLLALERGVFADGTQRIQCASRLVADALIRDCDVDPDRILLLPNAVDAERFGDPHAREAGLRMRRAFDLAEEAHAGARAGGHEAAAERIWLLAGSGWRRKGLGPALEAIAALADPGMRLWVAGRDDPAPWRTRAERLGLGRRVRFLGERADLPIVYGAVDGLLLPTHYDPFANVTLEAAAAGLPIVTTRANGAAEWLGDAVRVVERADDVGALASALGSFRQGEARRRAGEALRAHARALDWPSHVRSLRAEYARIRDAAGSRAAAR